MVLWRGGGGGGLQGPVNIKIEFIWGGGECLVKQISYLVMRITSLLCY